jgi:hypothetical protein
MNLSLKQGIIGAVIAIGLILIAIFMFGFGGMGIPVVNNDSKPAEDNSSNPALISSDPPELYIKKPLVVSPNQVIKLNFSVPLQNAPELKMSLEPAHEVNVELSADNKTATITPKTPYKLGQGYTLSIKPDTKLREEGKTLGKDYDLHFNVINYSGI